MTKSGAYQSQSKGESHLFVDITDTELQPSSFLLGHLPFLIAFHFHMLWFGLTSSRAVKDEFYVSIVWFPCCFGGVVSQKALQESMFICFPWQDAFNH